LHEKALNSPNVGGTYEKKQLPGILRFFIKLFQISLYIPIQIIFIPFAIIGLIDGIYREMGKSRYTA
jgi:hypothetical protein